MAGMVSVIEMSGLSLREINDISFNKHFVCANEYLNERETAHSTPSRSKKDSNPTAMMTEAFMTLDNISDKRRGCSCIMCCCPMKIKFRDNLYALLTEYI